MEELIEVYKGENQMNANTVKAFLEHHGISVSLAAEHYGVYVERPNVERVKQLLKNR